MGASREPKKDLTRRTFMHAAATTAALAMADKQAAGEGTPPRRPNVLLLMTDQHRGDAVGCYGNTAVHTPHLDSIAARGVRFPRGYSSLPSCTPARATLLTGWGGWRHGMLGYARVARKYDNELPRMLGEAGYTTYGIGKMHWFPERIGHGFDGTLVDESSRQETKGFISDYRQWFAEQAPDLDPNATGIGPNEYRHGVYKLPEQLHPTVWTGNMAVEYLGNYQRPEPWFLKVSFARPHSPYDPPKRLWDKYADADVPAPVKGDWADEYAEPAGGKSAYRGDFGPEQPLQSRRAYYANITFIDEQIGRILDALKRRGWLDDTLIVFTADHGDMLGDHNLWRKTYAYEGSARVPMLLSWPAGMTDAKVARGTELPQLVELRDVLPTLLDAAGTLGDYDESRFDGRSMLELVRGETAKWRTVLDLEHSRCYWRENQWNALTDERHKYIYFSATGREQLFDLTADPGEKVDLSASPAHARTLATLRAKLAALFHHQGRDEQWVKDGTLQTHNNILHGPNYPTPKKPKTDAAPRKG